MEALVIRTADPAKDAARLVEIYRPYVEKTAITFEYTTPSVEEFQGRMENTLNNCRYPYLVAVLGERIVGYAYVSPFVGREAYARSVETSIYLDEHIRHQGIGGKLYAALENVLREMHIINLNACIGVPLEDTTEPFLDTNSMDFHAHLGYRLVGRFHSCGYKFDTWLDMVWMEKMLSEHPEKPAPVLSYDEVRDTIREKYGIL